MSYLDQFKIIDEIKLSSADIRLLENEVIHIIIKTEQEVTIDMAKAISEGRERLSANKKRLVLYTTLSKIVIPSPEVRKYLAGADRSKYIIANALVISSLPQKIVSNFYMRINKPVVPTKFFDTDQAAMDWLLTPKS